MNLRTTLDVIPKLPHIYDEPFADVSQIPTYLVSQIAKQKVTVCLSGDAGDEIFGGYTRYSLLPRVQQLLREKKWLAAVIRCQPHLLVQIGGKLFGNRFATLSEKLFKLKRLLASSDSSEAGLYRRVCSRYDFPQQIVQGESLPLYSECQAMVDLQSSFSFSEWMMLVDTITYLNDDVLTKVDRAAMTVSLETRVPFLDHHVFELAWQLPIDYKIQNGVGKHILREVLYRHVPKQLIDRPKQGFSVPLARWLREELREWVEALLSSQSLEKHGYFHVDTVRELWHAHLRGKHDWSLVLWNILMFQAWVYTN